VVHVNDASRAVTVAGNLLGRKDATAYKAQLRAEYDKLREGYLSRSKTKAYLNLESARANRLQLDWKTYEPVAPAAKGVTEVTVTAAELEPYIDWTPFFRSWDLHGKYPEILSDDKVGVQATELFADAKAMLEQIKKENWFGIKGVFGIFPANSVDHDDIQLYDEQGAPTHKLLTLRQQSKKSGQVPNLALADFIAPESSGKRDHIGAFCVTAGFGVAEKAKAFEEAHDDYNSIMVKALADRLAEAFAEYLHLQVRKEHWGYASDEALNNQALIKEQYRGIRPAPGYPACPDHLEKETIWDLLKVEDRIGVTLTESLAMWPAASVSGYYLAHPESKYFGLGKILADQVEDYAQRRGISPEEAQKWLNPNIADR
jgi:5-methyltetrahydrofolate--homocysteine methyltransferase